MPSACTSCRSRLNRAGVVRICQQRDLGRSGRDCPAQPMTVRCGFPAVLCESSWRPEADVPCGLDLLRCAFGTSLPTDSGSSVGVQTTTESALG